MTGMPGDMRQELPRHGVVAAFQATSRLERAAVFDDTRLMPVVATADAAVAAPGWVGGSWRPGGTVLMAINPGGGTDSYRQAASDDELYGLIRAFRDADIANRDAAFRQMSDRYIQISEGHSIRRVIDAVAEAIDARVGDLAFLNILPFRTRENRPARASELTRAWQMATRHQVVSLAPCRIIALGCKAHAALTALAVDRRYETVLIKRTNGDRRVSAHARETLATLCARARMT